MSSISRNDYPEGCGRDLQGKDCWITGQKIGKWRIYPKGAQVAGGVRPCGVTNEDTRQDGADCRLCMACARKFGIEWVRGCGISLRSVACYWKAANGDSWPSSGASVCWQECPPYLKDLKCGSEHIKHGWWIFCQRCLQKHGYIW